jgi:superfamily I DNA/RNA helicase
MLTQPLRAICGPPADRFTLVAKYTNVKPKVGVVVMNMHKAKGKQFDEVIIFEGFPRRVNKQIVANTNRVVQANDPAHDTDEARQNLRVAITRARLKTLVVTPRCDPCILLLYRGAVRHQCGHRRKAQHVFSKEKSKETRHP